MNKIHLDLTCISSAFSRKRIKRSRRLASFLSPSRDGGGLRRLPSSSLSRGGGVGRLPSSFKLRSSGASPEAEKKDNVRGIYSMHCNVNPSDKLNVMHVAS